MQALIRFIKGLLPYSLVVTGASAMTVTFFMVLPLMQSIAKQPTGLTQIRTVDVAVPPPPPPPPEEEPEEEEESEEEPPELADETPPLDLSQLELALNPGIGEGMLAGDFSVKLNVGGENGENVDALFSMSDLDQRPRVIYQPSPNLTARVREPAPGTVYVIFIVNQRGRVENPKVQKSTDPVFERPALDAVKQWRFEPGKRNGEAVRFRMRVPITFPEQ